MDSKIKYSERSLAILLAFLPVLSIGASYGWGDNHSTYLIEGLKMAHPEMWLNDWWVNETIHYHTFFSYFVSLLETAGILTPAIALANVLVVFGSFYLVYLIIREAIRDNALQTFAAVILLFVFLHATKSVALTFFFIDSFQPSSFGVLGYLLGMYFFIRGRYLYSGLSVGIFSLFHANFLLLAFPLFGLAQLLIREDDFIKRCLGQFTPLVVSFLLLLPSIVSTLDPSVPKEFTVEALNIIFTIRSPWHYDFSFFWTQFIPFFGWLLLGTAALYFCLRETVVSGRFASLFWALVLIMVAAFIEAWLVGSDFFARLFIWRLAPFALLFSMILLIAAVFASTWLEKSNALASRLFFALFILGGLAVIVAEASLAMNFPEERAYVYAYMPVVLLIFWVINFFRMQMKKPFSPGKGFNAARVVLVLAIPLGLVLFQGPPVFDPCRFTYLDKPCHANENDLFRNVRNLTDENALFITPPDLVVFRLFTRRAVVASWNEVPFTPNETLEWYQRMSDIVGLEKITTWREVKNAYQNQAAANLIRLRQKYRVNFAVFRKEAPFNQEIRETFGPPVFENEEFYLFSLDPQPTNNE